MVDPSCPAPPPSPRLSHYRPRPGVAVVQPFGEVDGGSRDVPELVDVLAREHAYVVLDLRSVHSLGAHATTVLPECDRIAHRHGSRLIVVGLDPTSHRMLRICGVERELTVMDVTDGERAVGITLSAHP